METRDQIEEHGPFLGIPKFMLCAISGVLTGSCAIAGAFTGAFAGALAGRASDSGVLHGAVLGAVAGAVLSIEMLEASRAYWCLEQTGSRGTSAMADFIEELHGRFVDEQFSRSVVAAHHWQYVLKFRLLDVERQRFSTAAGDFEEINNIQDLVSCEGLSYDLLDKLPHHLIKEMKTELNLFCTICLQDIETGEIARSLPQCQHMFHLTCVDKWLLSHGSCPVCRQDV